jgi:diguanylate cyclase (GGDEF)-like protein
MNTNGLRLQFLVFFVLFSTLGINFLLWQHEKNNATLDSQAQLNQIVRDISSSIDQKLTAYEQVLRAVQGLYLTKTEVTAADFHAFIRAQRLGADFVGLQAIGIVMLPREPDAATRELHLSLLDNLDHAESLPEGMNLFAQDDLRQALEKVRDTGMAAIAAYPTANSTGKGSDGQALMLIFPLYGGQVRGQAQTQGKRNEAMTGWILAPFSMAALMSSVYGEKKRNADIRLYDGVGMRAQDLQYHAPASQSQADGAKLLRQVEYLNKAGHSWALEVALMRGEVAIFGKDRSSLIAVFGSLVCLMLALLTWQLLTGRERALNLARDMTQELRKSEARYRYLSQYDELTGLANRTMLKDRLQQAIIWAKRDKSFLALMFIDLDGFKPINDTLGHHVGDLLLKEVAQRMLDCIRESDIVARIGGDEFIVVLPNLEQVHDARFVGEKILLNLAQPFDLAGGHVIQVTASAGVAIYPQHGLDAEHLSKSADHAMYQAKQAGRNCLQVFGDDTPA